MYNDKMNSWVNHRFAENCMIEGGEVSGRLITFTIFMEC